MNVQSPLPGIPELTLQRHSDISLVDQIVQAIQQQIQNRLLKPGARLLSVRQFAAQYQVSTFTVEAYERLINLGLTEARRGAGYFVKKRAATDLQASVREPAFDALSPDWYSGVSASLLTGSGWLPPEWYGADTLPDAVRQAMRIPAQRLRGYGHPAGFRHCASIWRKRCRRICSQCRLIRYC
jgi:DNA-binding transcriptional MocR family regulator